MQTMLLTVWIAWMAIALLNTVAAYRYPQGLPFPEIPEARPPAAVIVAVKGASELSRLFFQRLRQQSYPGYRIIAAVESRDDPAFAMIREAAKGKGAPLQIVVAGLAERTGQKVHNLLAALEALQRRDEIVAFIDADTLPGAEWLSQLVASLAFPGRDAITGYRWIIPADGRLSSAVAAAANASLVTLPRLPFIKNHCWGGTMAMRQEILERIAIRSYWSGALSDDAQMTRAFNHAAIPVHSPRQSLLLSPVSMNWLEALSFGRRQYRIIWLHDKGLWALAAIGTALPAAAGTAAVLMALQGSLAAGILIAVSLVLGEVRYVSRRRIVAALWGEEAIAGQKTYWRVERWLRPLWLSFHAVCVLTAPFSRRISWAGIDYLVRGPQEVIVLRRAPAEGSGKEPVSH